MDAAPKATIEAGIDLYRRQITHIERLAAKSIGQRLRTLRGLQDGLPSDVVYTADLRGSHVVEYLAKVGPQWADGTYNLYVSHIRLWLKYLAAEGLLGADQAPWHHLKPRKLPKAARKKHFLRRDDVIKIAAAAAEWHVRDKYYILLSYAFRRRVSEMCAMRVGDLDLDPRPDLPWGCFSYHNIKGRKDVHGVPIIREDRPWVDEWLAEYETLLGRKPLPHEPLFPALKAQGRSLRGVRRPMVIVPGKALTPGSAGDAFRRAQEFAGDRVLFRGSHAARRGGLDDLLEIVDNDIRFVKTYAGHEREATTEVYLDRQRDMQDLARKLNSRTPDPQPTEAPAPPLEGESEVVVDFSARLRQRRSAG